MSTPIEVHGYVSAEGSSQIVTWGSIRLIATLLFVRIGKKSGEKGEIQVCLGADEMNNGLEAMRFIPLLQRIAKKIKRPRSVSRDLWLTLLLESSPKTLRSNSSPKPQASHSPIFSPHAVVTGMSGLRENCSAYLTEI